MQYYVYYVCLVLFCHCKHVLIVPYQRTAGENELYANSGTTYQMVIYVQYRTWSHSH